VAEAIIELAVLGIDPGAIDPLKGESDPTE